ncbi:ion channel [Desulfococcaceae bacterium HSG9]|nr:ion channel [Desulfococcaceae bacterium HSG9]
MHAVFQILKRFTIKIRKDNLHKVGVIVFALILLTSIVFWQFEERLSFGDAVWWSFVTVTTVGYGDISPASFGGRIVGIILMITGIGLLGILTATIASLFIEEQSLENKGMKSATVSGHFVICGWNFNGFDIIAELRADHKSMKTPIVLISQLNEKPLDDPNLTFIKGEINADVLNKANVGQAFSAILLSDDNIDVHVRDAKTILDTLTIKSLYPDLYVCVELVESKNITHCELAKADEIIVVGEITTNLLVQSVLDHGVTHLISELVSNRYGNEIYKIEAPSFTVGKTFLEMMYTFKKDHNVTCMAVENNSEGIFISNPESDYIICKDDDLVVIAKDRPQFA